jgi:hypothetical protein
MKYTVVYQPPAENELADLWTKGPDRRVIARATDEIDARLGMNPHAEGESRFESTRILIVEPLAVLYKVSESDRMVHVLKIWRFRPQRPNGQ